MLTINQPQLTSEQIAIIPEYRRKWQEIAITLYSKPIDRELAKDFAKIFLDTGFVFNRYIFPPLWQIQQNFINIVFRNLSRNGNLDENLKSGYQIVFTGKFIQSERDKYQLPVIQISSATSNVAIPSILTDYAYYIDYLKEVATCSLDSEKWTIFYDLITTCGWIFTYQKTALVCDRYLNS